MGVVVTVPSARRRRSRVIDNVRTDVRKSLRRTVERTFRAQLLPGLDALTRAVSLYSTNENVLLLSAFPEADIGPLDEEVRALRVVDTIPSPTSLSHPALAYPVRFAMETAHLRLLYKVVRLAKPAHVVETGVADGTSTRTILAALAANGTGRLTSIDVADDVGSLIEPALKSRWELVVLPQSGTRAAFRARLQQLRPVDIFLHDSDHTYGWQMFEYRLGYDALRPKGLLLSDDVDGSFAFIDFVTGLPARSYVCVGSRKVMGLVEKPRTDEAVPRA